MAFNKNLGYDPDKDYSLALQDTSLTDSQRNQLLSEREAKIAGQFGGVEPTMAGSDKTYTQLYGGNTGSQVTGGSAGGVSWDGDTDYSLLLGNAMKAGSTDADWLQGLLNSRIAKATYNPSLNQYADDDFARQVQAYIDALNQPEIELPIYDAGKWGGILDQAATELINMNYEDWLKGDQYKALAERYGHQGKMSMQDVLGQISSRTGGLASSYATTAAQQQYNDFMSTLEQAAMEMYGVERGDLLENAKFAQGMEQTQYDRYLDNLDQYWQQKEFTAGQDKLDKAQAADKAEMLAAYGDFSGYKALGYSDAEIALMQAAWQSQQAADAAKDKGKGGGGGYNNGGLSTEQVKQLQTMLGVTADGMWGSDSKKAANGMSADEAWAAYGGGGVTPDKTGGNYDYWTGSGTGAGDATSFDYDPDEGVFIWAGKTYNDANTLMQAIEAANLSDEQLAVLQRKFAQWGFDISID